MTTSSSLEDPKLQITFVDAAAPPLPDGDYVLTASQSVAWEDGAIPEPIESEFAFSVQGPRFSLDPSDVHAVFPPPNHRGHFDQFLPHAVFRRRSLPWERSPDGSIPDKGPYVPWLWLMCISASELAEQGIISKTVTVQDVLTPPKGTMGPELTLETGDDPSTKCTVIDVPSDFLTKIIPSAADLTAMSSAREVDVMNKETSIAAGGTWFSTLIANRFGADNDQNIVFLVSLEGYAKAGHNILSPNKAGDSSVRLVVLYKWSYENVAEPETFDELMEGLDVGRLELPLKSDDPAIQGALSRGYTALDHDTRHGEHTVSWYRSPLLPMNEKENGPSTFANGDAALRFDTSNAMFDVSYAAAWELGRLLSLRDGAFSGSVTRLRDGHKALMHRLADRMALSRLTAGVIALPKDARSLVNRQCVDAAFEKFLEDALLPALAPSDPDKKPILGAIPDPSSLRRRGALPGILNDEAVRKLIGAQATEVLATLKQQTHEE